MPYEQVLGTYGCVKFQFERVGESIVEEEYYFSKTIGISLYLLSSTVVYSRAIKNP